MTIATPLNATGVSNSNRLVSPLSMHITLEISPILPLYNRKTRLIYCLWNGDDYIEDNMTKSSGLINTRRCNHEN